MRIVFASSNYRLAADLAANFAGVEIEAIHASYAEAVDTVRESASGRVIDTAIVSDTLASARDRNEGMTLARALTELRSANPAMKIVVTTRSAAPIQAAAEMGAELFVEHDPDKSAANLAAKLGLVVKSEAALLVAVTGLEGGAGRSTIAANLASAFGDALPEKHEGGGVLLWEADLKHPTYAYTIGLVDPALTDHGRKTVARLISEDLSHADMGVINNAIVSGERLQRGYDLLLAPYNLREVLALYQSYGFLQQWAEQLRGILELVRRHYDVIVFDTGTDFIADPAPSMALAQADAVIVAATPSAGGLSNVRNMSSVILRDLHKAADAMLVINRSTTRTPDANKYLALIESEPGVPTVAARIPEGLDANLKVWDELAANLLRRQRR